MKVDKKINRNKEAKLILFIALLLPERFNK
jgi:hypothetical protein